jgi:predicted nucleic acid-binding protein
MKDQRMRVYFDACSLQWPLDDRTQPRVNLEAEAVLTLLHLIEGGDLELISSEALEFEVDRTPDPQRRAAGKDILKLAIQTLRLGEEVEALAEALIEDGIKPLDALHLAFASRAGVEYFCTSDDKLRKKAQRLKSLKTTVVTPLELVLKAFP